MPISSGVSWLNEDPAQLVLRWIFQVQFQVFWELNFGFDISQIWDSLAIGSFDLKKVGDWLDRMALSMVVTRDVSIKAGTTRQRHR